MIKMKLVGGLAVGVVLALMANHAEARHYASCGSHGSNGSSGGSYGSQGSSGGSYGSRGSSGSYGSHGSSGGSHGSSGGSHGSHGSRGYHGSHGSSGGSHGSSGGSYGSSGGSYGSHGSSGGAAAMSYYPGADAPAMVVVDPAYSLLELTVPADARVYLNNQLMTLAGTSRQYSIPGLQPGRQYRYPVRVEITRGGRLYRATAEPMLQAGRQVNLAFSDGTAASQVAARD